MTADTPAPPADRPFDEAKTALFEYLAASDDVPPLEDPDPYRRAMRRIGVRDEDLALYLEHCTPFHQPEVAAKSLARVFSDMGMALFDEVITMRLSDAVAWAIVGSGDSGDLSGPPRWHRYTRHGWLLQAAGLDPAEALAMAPLTEHDLRVMIGLRSKVAPTLLDGEPLEWPTG